MSLAVSDFGRLYRHGDKINIKQSSIWLRIQCPARSLLANVSPCLTEPLCSDTLRWMRSRRCSTSRTNGVSRVTSSRRLFRRACPKIQSASSPRRRMSQNGGTPLRASLRALHSCCRSVCDLFYASHTILKLILTRALCLARGICSKEAVTDLAQRFRMLEFRLKAYKKWLTMEEPSWSDNSYPKIDYNDYYYYSEPKQKARTRTKYVESLCNN